MIQTYYSDFEDGGNEKQFHFVEVLPSGSTDEPIHVTNENLLQESVKLTESLCSEDNLRFGACESSELTMTVANVFENFEGRTFHAYVHMLDDNSNDVIVNYGYFTVKSDKPQANRVWRKITAYDAMNTILNADVLTWFRGLTFPMTVAAFRNSFFTHLGITQKVQSLINDNFSIPGGFTASDYLSGKTIITAICELNGVFGHINRDGNFEYVSFGGNAGFVCPPFENNSVTYEDYTTDLITKITMRGSASDVGTSVGVDGNEYIITGNPLIYGTEGESTLITALNNLLAKIGTISFRPYTVGKTIGNPCVELGDAITVNTTYETITSAVVSRVLSGIQALRDKYSASGDKTYPTDVNSYSSEVSRTQGKMNELTRTVDETVSTVATYSTAIATANQNASTALSTVQQMANKIVLKVDSGGNIVKVALESDPSTGSTFKVSADNISFFANGVMELSANNLQINSTNFSVDSAGNLTCANATITGGKLDVQSTANGITNRMLVENGMLSQAQTYSNIRYVVEIIDGSVKAYQNGYKTFDMYQNGHGGSAITMQNKENTVGLKMYAGGASGNILSSFEVFNTYFVPNASGTVARINNSGAAYFSDSLSVNSYPDENNLVYGWTFLAPDDINPNRLKLRWNAPDGTSGSLYDTELGYLDGVTSNIQTQLDGKQASITGGATTIVSSDLTASRALISNSSGKVAVSAVTSTELGYLDGVTSAIQTQLDGKVAKSGDTMSGVLNSTYKSASWVKSLTSSAISLSDTASSFGGWICGPTKNGRIAISTYQASNDMIYFGYGERGRTTNSYVRQMTWDGGSGLLTTGTLKLSGGRVAGAGDDEGLVIAPASNNYAGVICGDPSGRRSVFYLCPSGTNPKWRYNNGTTSYDLTHPGKSGTILVDTDADTAATANTVAKRQGNGYLYATYFNTTAGSENPASFTSYPAFISSDGFLRRSTLANFQNFVTGSTAFKFTKSIGTINYQKCYSLLNGHINVINVRMTGLSGLVENKGAVQLGSIPSANAPSTTFYCPFAHTGSVGGEQYVYIETDGKVYIAMSNASSVSQVMFNIVYVK